MMALTFLLVALGGGTIGYWYGYRRGAELLPRYRALDGAPAEYFVNYHNRSAAITAATLPGADGRVFRRMYRYKDAIGLYKTVAVCAWSKWSLTGERVVTQTETGEEITAPSYLGAMENASENERN